MITPQKGEKSSPLEAMRFAVELAKLGVGYVSPNPLVGCVILDKNNSYLSSGYHKKCGEAHAEANALSGLTKD